MKDQANQSVINKQIVMLHIFPSFGFGGQQARFATLATGLGPAFRHHVVALDGDVTAQRLICDDTDIQYQKVQLQKGKLPALANYFRLRSLFTETSPNILCTYNWGAIDAVIANATGPRLINIHFEDGFGPDETPEQQLSRRVQMRRMALGRAHVIVPSRGLKKAAAEKWRVKADRLHLMVNGIDVERFQNGHIKQGGGVTIGSVGALRPEKNYQRLVTAFSEAQLGKDSQLKIVGDGPERNNLEAIALQISDNPNTIFTGATSTPETSYLGFDIFALSSDTEQAPLTVLEAMASGLPIVSTDVGDISEMVSNENRAFITPLGNDRAYIEAISHLAQNPEARSLIGAANRAKAKAQFQASMMVEAYRNLYQEILGPVIA